MNTTKQVIKLPESLFEYELSEYTLEWDDSGTVMYKAAVVGSSSVSHNSTISYTTKVSSQAAIDGLLAFERQGFVDDWAESNWPGTRAWRLADLKNRAGKYKGD